MSSVRFLSDFSHSNPPVLPSASRETQTIPVQHFSVGTEPSGAPEKVTQTDKHLLWNLAASKTQQISVALVDTILDELDRMRRESALLDAHERQLWGTGERQQQFSLGQAKSVKLAKIEAAADTVVTAIRCGPVSRRLVVLLFGRRQHDSWCSDHRGGQLLLVNRQGQAQGIPLSACPSDALFARHGELLIVGMHNGELLLVSCAQNDSGEVLWSSGNTLHNASISRLRLISGTGERELLSVGMDGKLLRSRLEPDNRLEPIQSLMITVVDLPRTLRRTNVFEERPIGLVDVVWPKEDLLFVATDTGVLVELQQKSGTLSVLQSYAFGGEGSVDPLDQIIATWVPSLLDQNAEGQQLRLICRTFDGRIHKWLLQMGGSSGTIDSPQLIPVDGRAQGEISSLLPAVDLLFFLSVSGAQRELLAIHADTGQLEFRDNTLGSLDAIALDRDGQVLIAFNQAQDMLLFCELHIG